MRERRRGAPRARPGGAGVAWAALVLGALVLLLVGTPRAAASVQDHSLFQDMNGDHLFDMWQTTPAAGAVNRLEVDHDCSPCALAELLAPISIQRAEREGAREGA